MASLAPTRWLGIVYLLATFMVVAGSGCFSVSHVRDTQGHAGPDEKLVQVGYQRTTDHPPTLQDRDQVHSPQAERLVRGVHSSLTGLTFPLGRLLLGDLQALATPERMEHGLTIVLPGVEGRGPLNGCIAQGVVEGGWPGAVVIHDWTTGVWPLFLYHLRASERNRHRASELAALVVSYQDKYPGRPVFLIGHSGGGAMAVWTLEALPQGRSVRGAVLLGAALSPDYPLGPALCRVETAVWNFWSLQDLLFLAGGTFVFGTVDSQHTVSAGWGGFHVPQAGAERTLYDARLRQFGYRLEWATQFHPGTHLGWANRVFVAETLAPLLEADQTAGRSPPVGASAEVNPAPTP